VNYEVSANGGTTWFTNASPLVLTQTGGTVATTTISVRLNATTTGTYTGNIANASTGATTMNVAVNGTATPSSIITATGTLTAFTQVLGNPSAVQTYSVSATGLTANMTITPPANYEVSADGSTWFTNASPLVLTQTAGVIAATTISVRLNATVVGSYNGNIVHTSTGAINVNVPVTGNTVPVPSIVVTGTLTAFSHTVGTPSVAQTYTVSGANLLGSVTITPPVNFEVSGDGGTTWRTNTTPLVLTATAGTLATTTISVRMNAIAAGPASGNIAHTSTSAPTVNLPVTGNAIPTPLITLTGTLTPFTQVLGVVSPVQTYTVTGANLTGNITITPPADYEISSNGGTSWTTAPIVLTQTAGTVAATTISVRLNSIVLGAHAGNITHVSSGAVTKNMAVSGTTVPKPVIIVTQNFTTFIQTVGGPAPVQSYTVAGTNLTGNILITPPAHYQVSTNFGSSWQSTTATLTRVNGAVAPTTMMIRLNVPVTGMFSGVLIHISTDADSVNVNLNGYNKVTGEYVLYPSPASRVVFMAHPITAEKATLTFYTTSGQKMATYSTQPGAIETPIDVQMLPQGIYYVEYRLGEKRVMLKFVKS
jgi:hypothetical protein